MCQQKRIERDALGTMEMDAALPYGIQTARAIENFSVSDICIADIPQLVESIVQIKCAAARANQTIGAMPADIAQAIRWAAEHALERVDRTTFPVDIYHGGGGTAANMNVNEVIGRLASQHPLMAERGVGVHPNDHVNLGQSTNDVIPSAMKMATYAMLGRLTEELEHLRVVVAEKEAEFADVVKIGRTCLQDALPMTFGQQFSGYREALARQLGELRRVQGTCLELPLGATAVGTQFGTHPGYIDAVFVALNEQVGGAYRPASNLFDGLQNADGWMAISGTLKAIASVLNKICADLRLMSSGPRAGLAEVELPSVQPGSSIMPGKVNPVIPEMVIQVYFRVLGNDLAVSRACEGELDLNVWESSIIASISESAQLLTAAIPLLANRCIRGLRVDVARSRRNAQASIAMSTVIAALYDYRTASEVAQRAAQTGQTIAEVVLARGMLSADDARKLLDPAALTSPTRFHALLRAARQAQAGTGTT